MLTKSARGSLARDSSEATSGCTAHGSHHTAAHTRGTDILRAQSHCPPLPSPKPVAGSTLQGMYLTWWPSALAQ